MHITGRLAAAPETDDSALDEPVAHLTVIVSTNSDHRGSSGAYAHHYRVTLYGENARAATHLQHGHPVTLEGDLTAIMLGNDPGTPAWTGLITAGELRQQPSDFPAGESTTATTLAAESPVSIY